MKTALKNILFFLSLLLLFVSCTGGKTKTEIRFSQLPGEKPLVTPSGFDVTAPEPMAPTGGFIYIQTGYGSDAKVLGPYPIAPGKALLSGDIPKGTYPRLVLFYSPQQIELNPVFASDDRDFWTKVNAPSYASDVLNNGGGAVLFGDITFTSRKKILQATVIPVTSISIDSSSPELPVLPDTSGAVRKQFFRLQNASLTSVYVMLSMFNGQGLTYVGTVSLYDAAGTIADTKILNRPITEESPQSVLFDLQKGITYFLYLEYSAKGNRKLDLSFF